MKLTKLRGRMLCVPHLNGSTPRRRYLGCDACESLIAQERAEKAIPLAGHPPKMDAMSTAEKLRSLRGGKRPRRVRRGTDAPRSIAPPLLFSLEGAIRKLWPLDENGCYRW